MKHVFSVAAVIAALSAHSADAQEVCMPAGEMKASLIDWYGEKPVGYPDAENKQLWISERTGSWTMVRFQSDGIACTTAQGENWYTELQGQNLLAALRD